MKILSLILILATFPLAFLSFVPTPDEEKVGTFAVKLFKFLRHPYLVLSLFVLGFILLFIPSI